MNKERRISQAHPSPSHDLSLTLFHLENILSLLPPVSGSQLFILQPKVTVKEQVNDVGDFSCDVGTRLGQGYKSGLYSEMEINLLEASVQRGVA